MAHLIDMSNGRANMAYTGQTPWHSLGSKIEADASIDDWRKAAGLEWSIKKGSLVMQLEDGSQRNITTELNRTALYRDDTFAPLSIMSADSYKIVQPDEILDFIGSSVKAMGWKMETAGSLKGGRKIWALANCGDGVEVGKGDLVKPYLLAATSCDGSMASEFMFTTVSVVCNNTLHMALQEGKDSQHRVKVYHFNELDVNAVKTKLGIATTTWARFIENAKQLAKIHLSPTEATQILRKVYDKPVEKEVDGEVLTDEQFLIENKVAQNIFDLYDGEGIGMGLRSRKGTAWGLVNATTEYYDHAARTRSDDNRLDSTWFGAGAQRKQDIINAILV